MSIDQDLIRLIDQRIQSAQQKTEARGTCVSRDTTGPGADVLFDGSTVAMPVKVLGGVFLQPGNRCVLDKYGSDWVVTGSWSALGLGEASQVGTGPVGGTGGLTSGTFVDLTELAVKRFDKVYDATYVRMGVGAACVSSASSTAVRFALRFTPLDPGGGYTATDYNATFIYFNVTGTHLSAYSASRITGMPAGSYNVQLRWRRSSGAGSLTADQNDVLWFELDEGIRASVPIL